MDGVPEDPRAKTAKAHAFDQEPFRSDILDILAKNPGCYVSSIYDVLCERYTYGEDAENEMLPGNEQTLRNYIKWLRDTGQITEAEKRRRTYDHVDDPPAGKQPRLDFGQTRFGAAPAARFLCLLLRMSRFLGACAQDHKSDPGEARVAACRLVCKVGGRPEELVIDQDSVFVGREIYGEVFETETFKGFLEEQELGLWCRDKHDPESKGAVLSDASFYQHTSAAPQAARPSAA